MKFLVRPAPSSGGSRIFPPGCVHYSERARTCHLLCKRPGCYHSASKTHVRDRIIKRVRTCHLLYKRPGCYHSTSKTHVETGSLNWNPEVSLFSWIFDIFSPERAQTWSLGATESEVWIGNLNVKAWKSTKHKLHKIWRSLKFLQNFRKTSTSLRWAQTYHSAFQSCSRLSFVKNVHENKTRMHSSRMCTVRFSGLVLLGWGLPLRGLSV